MSLRTALICFWLIAVPQRNFHIINLAALVDALPWRTRRDLGIDYKTSQGQAKQVSYNQLLRVFHNMAAAFDPYAPDLADEVAYASAAHLQELCNRLLRA